MTTSTQSTIKMNSPRDLVAAVPHLLGFWPTDSLILIGFRNEERSIRFGMTLRSDFPRTGDHRALADYLINGPLRNQEVNAVVLVLVGGSDHGDAHAPAPSGPEAGPSAAEPGRGGDSADDAEPVDSVDSGGDVPSMAASTLPHRELVEDLTGAFTSAGIEVLHSVWTPEIRVGGAWACYAETDCNGDVPDPQGSVLAAAMAASGAVTFDSRKDVEALVAPEADDLIARRAAKLDGLQEDREWQRSGAAAVQEDLRMVYAGVQRTHDGIALTEDDHARILLALSDSRVRDLVMGTALGDLASAAEQLWLILVRKAPSPELADVAALLAFSSYLRGEGALAGAALQRIESTRPDHRLGNLLRQALDAGLPASELSVIARDAADDARMLIEEDSEW